ncbi:MAG: ArsR family transcriptional regulator [Anaerolineae bacterium]|nr:MAG: ArsR family transcriptional regulator [Anaerolineae bacterium]
MLNYFSEVDSPLSALLPDLVTYLKALAEPNRLRIFNLLMEGVHCNCELGERLGLPPNLISHHLAILRQAGLVNAERSPSDLRWIYYAVNREALARLNAALQTFLDPSRLQPRQPSCPTKVKTPSSTHPITASR